MPDPISAVVGSAVIGGVAQSRAAKSAAGAQQQSAQAGIDEQGRQFDEMRRLLQPYVDVGQPALTAQQAQLGLLGPEQQQAAMG